MDIIRMRYDNMLPDMSSTNITHEISSIEEPHDYAIGVFDGVHLGHKKVISSAILASVKNSHRSGVITFDGSPEGIAGIKNQKCIMPLGQRLRIFESLGVDTTVILEFDRELASLEPEDFVEEILLKRLKLSTAVIGENHTFGKGGRGTADLLRILSERMDFDAVIVEPVEIDGTIVSSTLIRSCIEKGNMADAAMYLGRLYDIEGAVVEGRRLGRKLGFPTINIDIDENCIMPAKGVYTVALAFEDKLLWGVGNIGTRPTVDGKKVALEINIFDFNADIYGKKIDVAFLDYLRPEMKFNSLEELSSRIAFDKRQARHWIDRIPAKQRDSILSWFNLHRDCSVIK